MHLLRRITVLCTAALLAAPAAILALQQEPATPPPALEAQTSAASSSKPGSKKYSHVNDFLILGTVFDDRAISFQGVRLRIRRAGEKKFRWQSYTNSRGEFAVRVPRGSNYEMVVGAKGFEEQTRAIAAKNGGNEERLVFRMQPTVGDKK